MIGKRWLFIHSYSISVRSTALQVHQRKSNTEKIQDKKVFLGTPFKQINSYTYNVFRVIKKGTEKGLGIQRSCHIIIMSCADSIHHTRINNVQIHYGMPLLLGQSPIREQSQAYTQCQSKHLPGCLHRKRQSRMSCRLRRDLSRLQWHLWHRIDRLTLQVGFESLKKYVQFTNHESKNRVGGKVQTPTSTVKNQTIVLHLPERELGR